MGTSLFHAVSANQAATRRPVVVRVPDLAKIDSNLFAFLVLRNHMARQPTVLSSKQSIAPTNGPGWIQFLKLFCKMFRIYSILLFTVIVWRTVSVSHSLLGTYTAVNTDEFTCVLWLDGEAVDSYSSNGMDSVPRRNWMREGRGRSLWKPIKHRNMKHWNRGRIDILKNDTGLNISAQPTAAVFAKRSLSPGRVILTCLVSGFHCSNMTVEVYRDDDIITEEDGLLSSGIRPNGDGTCQLRKSLDISNSTEASYSCEVLFGSLKRLVKWDGVIWDMAAPRQGYNRRHHYWLLTVPFEGFFIFIQGVIYRLCTQANQRTEDSISAVI